MHSVRRFLAFESMFLYGGVQEDGGLGGLLLDTLAFIVLCVIFIPLMPDKWVLFVLVSLSLIWVNRCLNSGSRFYDLMPVSKGYAASAAMAAPLFIFIVGWIPAGVIVIVFGFLNNILIFYNTLPVEHIMPLLGSGVFINIFGVADRFAIFLIFLFTLSAGTALMMIKNRIIRIIGLVVLTAAVYASLYGLVYKINGVVYFIGAFHSSFSLDLCLIIVDIIVVPLAVLCGRILYRRRFYPGGEEKILKPLRKAGAFEQALVSSFAHSRSGRGSGLANLLIFAAVFYASCALIFPLIPDCWPFFFFIIPALATVNRILNSGDHLYQMMPVSNKYAVGGIFALSLFAYLTYYLVVVNLFNLFQFFMRGRMNGLPLNIILSSYHAESQAILFAVLTVLITLFAGTALLMIRDRVIRFGSLAILTAALYVCLRLLKDAGRLRLAYRGDLLSILTAVVCALVIPLSVFSGYRFYCRRFPKKTGSA